MFGIHENGQDGIDSLSPDILIAVFKHGEKNGLRMSKVCISLQGLLDDVLYPFSKLHVEEIPWSIDTGRMGLDKEPERSIDGHEGNKNFFKSFGVV